MEAGLMVVMFVMGLGGGFMLSAIIEQNKGKKIFTGLI